MYARFAVIGFMLLLAPTTALLQDTEAAIGQGTEGFLHALSDEYRQDQPSNESREPAPQSETPVEPDQILSAIPTTTELLAEIQGMFYSLEEQVQTLQDTLLVLPTDEQQETKPQASLVAPPDAKWYAQPAVWVAAAVASTGAIAFFWVSGSSAAATTGARKPVFSPLFTRFEGEQVLAHPRRAELYAAVSEKPGIRLQDLCDETKLSRTAVTHHLRLLEQQHVVVSKRVGRSRHFFENGGRYATHQKDAYALLQNDRSRDIMDLIRAEPGIIQKAICEGLDLQASIAHWHIKRLAEAGLVDPIKQGRTVQYYANSVA